MERRVLDALHAHFRPEFLNRVDDVVIFHALSREDLRQIIDIQLLRIRDLLADRNITIELTDAAKDLLIEEGFDPAFGARPLKRVLQRRVQDELALLILRGDILDGDHVVVDRSGDDLTFNVIPGEREEEEGETEAIYA
jgi:ATP-dependent Clp protease ATP-binding subunit ClpB